MNAEEIATKTHCTMGEVVDMLRNGKVKMPKYAKDAPHNNANLVGNFEEQWEMPNLRALKKDKDINSTGADGLFCNDITCLKQKDEVMTLSGMRNYDDEIGELLTKLGREYKDIHDEIKECQKRLKQKEVLMEALAVRLGYDHVSFNEQGVRMQRENMQYDFPPPWNRSRNRSRRSDDVC